MSVPVTLEAIDLAALLCSRVCHDLISPAGAIVNGLEVFEEEWRVEDARNSRRKVKITGHRSAAWPPALVGRHRIVGEYYAVGAVATRACRVVTVGA